MYHNGVVKFDFLIHNERVFMYTKLKTYIFKLLLSSSENSLASRVFDFFIISLILVNVVTVIAETFSLPIIVMSLLYYIEIFSIVIFTIEYILRFWTSDYLRNDMPPFKARLKYIFSFMALVDLLAILPFFIPYIIKVDLRILRTIRVVRLLRLFKMNRYTKALSSISYVFKKKAPQLLSSIFIVFLLMVVSSVLMYNFENSAQPDKFTNAFSALWWAVATLTTVGYGDIYPITVAGKILSSVIALLGIGLVAVPTSIISAGFLENIGGHKEVKCDNEYCPKCGNKLSIK
jgi:voltage-gated potassium channel